MRLWLKVLKDGEVWQREDGQADSSQSHQRKCATAETRHTYQPCEQEMGCKRHETRRRSSLFKVRLYAVKDVGVISLIAVVNGAVQ